MRNTLTVEFREGLGRELGAGQYDTLYSREYLADQPFVPPTKDSIIVLPNMKHYRLANITYTYRKDGSQLVFVYVLPMAFLD